MAKEKTYYILEREFRGEEPEQLKIEVTVVDRRTVFGREEVLIIPVAGSGKWWVGIDKVVTLDPKVLDKVYAASK